MERAGTYIKRARDYLRNGKPVIYKNISVGSINYGNCLKGRKILITGGGKGLGFAIAEKCLNEGAKVVITGRNIDTLNNAVNRLGNRNVYALEFDISNSSSMKEKVDVAIDLLGGLDSVISNAGVSLHEKSWDSVSSDQWDVQMDTNLRGTYFLAQEFLRYRKSIPLKKGSFIIMSSERGLYGDDIPYGLTKAALNDFTYNLSIKARELGIRVNAIAPGVTATEMTGHDPNGNLFRLYAKGRRILLSEEIAEATVFLMSDYSSCISGIVIPCNEANHLR